MIDELMRKMFPTTAVVTMLAKAAPEWITTVQMCEIAKLEPTIENRQQWVWPLVRLEEQGKVESRLDKEAGFQFRLKPKPEPAKDPASGLPRR